MAMRDGEPAHRGEQARHALLAVGGAVGPGRVVGELVVVRRDGLAARDVREPAVVGDTEHERALARFAAKAVERAPDRERDVLREIVLIGGPRVRRDDAPEPAPVLGHEPREPRLLGLVRLHALMVSVGARTSARVRCVSSISGPTRPRRAFDAPSRRPRAAARPGGGDRRPRDGRRRARSRARARAAARARARPRARRASRETAAARPRRLRARRAARAPARRGCDRARTAASNRRRDRAPRRHVRVLARAKRLQRTSA